MAAGAAAALLATRTYSAAVGDATALVCDANGSWGSAAALRGDLERARAALQPWAQFDAPRRRNLLAAIASLFREERFDTIQIMAAEAAKVAREGDPEVSEAIDFANFTGAGVTTIEGTGTMFNPTVSWDDIAAPYCIMSTMVGG